MKHLANITELEKHLRENGVLDIEMKIVHKFKLTMDKMLNLESDIIDALMQFNWYMSDDEMAVSTDEE